MFAYRYLMAHGADVAARDKRGRTPLHVACRAVDRIAVKVGSLLRERLKAYKH